MDIASAGENAPNEEAMSSTDVLNCSANTTNAGEAILVNAFAMHDIKTLRCDLEEAGLRSECSERQVRNKDTHSVQKQASFFHHDQFNLG